MRTTGHRARRAGLVLALAALAGRTPEGRAQTMLQRPVNAGDVTGLELGIEGTTQVVAGGRARLLVAAQEVTGLDGLRPGPRVRVRALASFSPQSAVAEARTDEHGRAALEFDVPAEVPSTFHLILEAVSDRGVRRQFEFDMHASAPQTLWLEVDRREARPGDRVTVWGRLAASVTGQGLREQSVVLDLTDDQGRTRQADVQLRTDGAGAFSAPLELPSQQAWSTLTVRARAGTREYPVYSTVSLSRASAARPALRLQAVAMPRVARPGQTVTVEAVMRTADGRPVRNAVVTSPQLPRPAGLPASQQPSLRTDPQGRVRFQFDAPRGMGAYAETNVSLSAQRAGLGSASASAPLRVAAAGLLGTVAVEGGALVPGQAGRLYVRVLGPDGMPAGAGVQVSVTGPRLARGLTGTTGEGGVAALEVTVAPQVTRTRAPRPAAPAAEGAEENTESEPEDSCGGTTATGWRATLQRGDAQGSLEGCLALDPDASVRVRLEGEPVVRSGGRVAVRLERVASVSRWPTEVALLRLDGATEVPLSARVLAANEARAELAIPADVRGVLLVRARPLHPGDSIAVRGGMTALWALPGGRLLGQLAEEGGSLHVQGRWAVGATQEPALAVVSVLPREQAEALSQRVRTRAGALLGDLRADPASADALLLGGALASLTPLDDGAPAVWRDGRVVNVPAPEEPAQRGILRDPWRARARFVEGRLALLFREVEQHVASRVHERRADVAVRGAGGRWTFNRELFDALLSGREGTEATLGRSLGGAPLSIEVLARLDPAFNFDNVARRITRRRMFRVLLALRRFVNEHALDLRWSWRGDPTVWLRTLVEDSVGIDEEGNTLTEEDLRDGWGNPLALRAAPGGHNRFTLLAPVPGFDLVSAGPDERFGSGDDVLDPTARVLPSGGAFARAVDEDGLLARLHGVELGRATVRRLSEVFEVEANSVDSSNEDAHATTTPAWGTLPTRAALDPHALDLVRPQVWAQTQTQRLSQLDATAQALALSLDDEPRTWGAVLEVWTASGVPASAESLFSAGRPVLLSTPLHLEPEEDPEPELLHLLRNEPVSASLSVTNLLGQAQSYQLAIDVEGSASVEGAGRVQVPAGETADVSLRVRAAGLGRGALRISLRDAQNQPLRQLRIPFVVDADALELRQDVGALAEAATWRPLSLGADPGAEVRGARLVLVAPGALAEDPEFERVRERDPALAAWALTVAGRTLPESLSAALFAAQAPSSGVSYRRVRGRLMPTASGGGVPGELAALSTAMAAVVWSGAPETDTRAATARTAALAALSGQARTYEDEGGAGSLRGAAALVAALATGAGSDSGSEGIDPVGSLVESLRAELRNAQGSFPRQPTVLARAAAALLLADPSDARAVALFDAARRAVRAEGNGSWLRGGEGRTAAAEELTGTAALAVAAQQRGETELARALLRGLAPHAHRAWRAGGDAAFWVLATAAYGVWGVGEAASVQVRVGGVERTMELRGGRALLEVPVAGGEARAEVRGAEVSALARLELRYASPWTRSDAGPVRVNVEGDVGFLGELAALELTVQNSASRAAERVLVEVQLPAASVLDPPARTALQGLTSGLELRGSVLRFELARVEAGQTVRLPLALRWLGAGELHGLGAVAYARARPAVLTRLPPRVLSVRERAAD